MPFSALTKPLLYFASAWGWVLGVRVADRIGKGIRTAPRDALIADSIDDKQRGLAFGLHRASDTLGAFLGLGIAAIIIWRTQAQASLLSLDTFKINCAGQHHPWRCWESWSWRWAQVEVTGTSKGPTRKRTPCLSKKWTRASNTFYLSWYCSHLEIPPTRSSSCRGQERGLNLLQVMGMSLTFNALIRSSQVRSARGLIKWAAQAHVDRLAGVWTGVSGIRLFADGWQVWTLFALYGLYYAANRCGQSAGCRPCAQRSAAQPMDYNAAIGITVLPASLIAGLLWQGIGAWTGFGASAPFFFGASDGIAGGIIVCEIDLKRQLTPAHIALRWSMPAFLRQMTHEAAGNLIYDFSKIGEDGSASFTILE